MVRICLTTRVLILAGVAALAIGNAYGQARGGAFGMMPAPGVSFDDGLGTTDSTPSNDTFGTIPAPSVSFDGRLGTTNSTLPVGSPGGSPVGSPGGNSGSGSGGTGAPASSLPQAHSVTSAQSGGLSLDALAVKMGGSVQPMLKSLSSLPASVNLTSVTSHPVTAQPVVVSGQAISATSQTNAPALPTMKTGSVSSQSAPAPGIGPQNYGAGNQNTVYHYNDLLVDSPTGEAVVNYPQAPTGYLIFTFDNSNWFYCTATLINPSVIVEAGHCAHQGNNSSSGWIKQGYFFPACFNCNTASAFLYYGGAQVAWAVTTGGWYANGGLDQGYDVSMMVLLNRIGTSTEMGQSTGWLGFCYSNCLQSDWALT